MSFFVRAVFVFVFFFFAYAVNFSPEVKREISSTHFDVSNSGLGEVSHGSKF